MRCPAFGRDHPGAQSPRPYAFLPQQCRYAICYTVFRLLEQQVKDEAGLPMPTTIKIMACGVVPTAFGSPTAVWELHPATGPIGSSKGGSTKPRRCSRVMRLIA